MYSIYQQLHRLSSSDKHFVNKTVSSTYISSRYKILNNLLLIPNFSLNKFSVVFVFLFRNLRGIVDEEYMPKMHPTEQLDYLV